MNKYGIKELKSVKGTLLNEPLKRIEPKSAFLRKIEAKQKKEPSNVITFNDALRNASEYAERKNA